MQSMEIVKSSNREIGLASEGRDHGMKTARDSMQWEIRKEKKIEAGVTS